MVLVRTQAKCRSRWGWQSRGFRSGSGTIVSGRAFLFSLLVRFPLTAPFSVKVFQCSHFPTLPVRPECSRAVLPVLSVFIPPERLQSLPLKHPSWSVIDVPNYFQCGRTLMFWVGTARRASRDSKCHTPNPRSRISSSPDLSSKSLLPSFLRFVLSSHPVIRTE